MTSRQPLKRLTAFLSRFGVAAFIALPVLLIASLVLLFETWNGRLNFIGALFLFLFITYAAYGLGEYLARRFNLETPPDQVWSQDFKVEIIAAPFTIIGGVLVFLFGNGVSQHLTENTPMALTLCAIALVLYGLNSFFSGSFGVVLDVVIVRPLKKRPALAVAASLLFFALLLYGAYLSVIQ